MISVKDLERMRTEARRQKGHRTTRGNKSEVARLEAEIKHLTAQINKIRSSSPSRKAS